MRTFRVGRLLALVSVISAAAVPLTAQQQFAGRAGGYMTLEAMRAERMAIPAPLARSVNVRHDRVLLQQALLEISTQAGLGLTYGSDLARDQVMVSIDATDIPAAEALLRAVTGTRWQVWVTRSGLVTVAEREEQPNGGTVRGRVTDARTGKGIISVSVTIDGTSLGTHTGEDGAYAIAKVPPGDYTLTARRIGYVKSSRSITVYEDQQTTADFAMDAAQRELEAMVVTGSVVATARREIPTAISVVRASEIERSGVTSVDELFRGTTIPGAMAFDNGSLNPLQGFASIRGTSSFNPNQFKTYVDGVQVANAFYLTTLDPSIIDRIEVLRGPQGSTVYGSDANGGVLQIFTKKGTLGSQRPMIDLTLSGGAISGQYAPDGSAPMQDHTLSIRGGTPDFSYNVGASYINKGEWVPHYKSMNKGAFVGMHGTQGTLSGDISIRYNERTFSIPTNAVAKANFPMLVPGDETNIDKFSDQTFGLRLGYAATGNWQHNLTLGFSRDAADNATPTPPGGTPYLSLGTVDGTQTTLSYNNALSLGADDVKATIVSGLESTIHRNNVMQIFGNIDPSTGVKGGISLVDPVNNPPYIYNDGVYNTGYFAQVETGLFDKLFLTTGIRAERNSALGKDYGTAWAPRVGIAYNADVLGVSAKLRASYGRGLRPPPTFARVALRDPNQNQLANPDLGPETNIGPEVGADLYFGHIASVSATYYDQKASGLVSSVIIDAGQAPPVTQFENVGRIHNRGWETEAKLYLGDRVTLGGTYSTVISDVLAVDPNYGGALRVGDRLLNVPSVTAGGTMTVNLTSSTSVRGDVSYLGHRTSVSNIALYNAFVGGTYTGNQRDYWETFPSRTVTNISLQQVISNQFTVFARVNNLSNNQLGENTDLNVTQGRTVIGGIRMHF